MKTLYETDFVEWSDRTAELLRAGRFDELEIENVAEEIASLGKAERKAVRSQLQRLIMHKIKQQIQPERDGNSWQAPIAETILRIPPAFAGISKRTYRSSTGAQWKRRSSKQG